MRACVSVSVRVCVCVCGRVCDRLKHEQYLQSVFMVL